MRFYYAHNIGSNISERISETRLRCELRRQGKAQDHNIERIRRGETVKGDFAEYSLTPKGRVL